MSALSAAGEAAPLGESNGAARLGGREVFECTLAVRDAAPVELVAVGRRPAIARLGGTYSFGFMVVSPFSEPSRLWGLLPLMLPPPTLPPTPRSLDSTPSTMVFLTFFLVNSFLRSARAASDTPGPENSSITDCLAQSRT
jgi:hypothetical protein